MANRAKEQTLIQWQPLAAVLGRAIPERNFVVEALNYQELEEAIASRHLEFVLTNPSHYVLLSRRSGLSSPLATQATEVNGQRLNIFGGVIFTRSDASGIDSLKDIVGRRVALASTESLGGYRMQAYELRRAGLPLPNIDQQIITGMPQDRVVDEVLSGRADVGFMRSGILEDLASRGRLDPAQVKIINSQNLPSFPFRVSTHLYPEWPFASMPHTEENLARRVAAALFTLKESGGAQSLGIHSFSVPSDYSEVESLLRELRLPPFDIVVDFSARDVWRQYRWQIIGLALAVIIIVALSIRLWLARGALRRDREFLLTLVNNLPALVWLKDPAGIYLGCNQRFESFFGASEAAITGKTDYDFVSKELADSFRHHDRLVMENNTPSINEEEVTFASDGHTEVLETIKTPLRDSSGRPMAVLGIGHNITARKLAEAALKDKTDALARSNAQLEQMATVFIHCREGIMITAPDGTIIDVNDAFCRITGYSRTEVIGNNPRMLHSGRQGPDFYTRMWRTLLGKGYWTGEVWDRRKDGGFYAALLTISAVRDERGNPRHYVALFTDITAQKEHEKQLEYTAHYDSLTGLPNRMLLADRLRQALGQSRRHSQPLAVAYIDLDGFKAVNDNYGHAAGDYLLMVLATRMKQCLRESDTIARLGGDEFVVVLGDLANMQISVPFVLRLLEAAAQPVEYKDEVLQVSSSIGVAICHPGEETDADQLLRQADQAMYQAKLAGKNRYHVFDAEHDRTVRDHHESVEFIRAALANREFVLYYQPKVSLRSGALIGVEALIRWQHPERGLLLPGAFLPDIEEQPVGIELGEWVIDTALSQIEAWQGKGLEIPVSVNIAANHLQQADFVERLQGLLASHHRVPPSYLELEVLETSALKDIGHVSRVINACAEIGVGFALDDFGTGYSSLTYLKRLPANVLKIDQSFVRDMLHDPDDLAILEGILGLASAFRRQAIAEGVETVAHGEMLLELGCELAQGYGIAHPMVADDIPLWRSKWQPPKSWLERPVRGRDYLPLLFAKVEQEAWMDALEAYLEQDSEAPPMDSRACRFGIWLHGEGRQRYGRQKNFQTIDRLHDELHHRADALVTMKTRGYSTEAMQGFSDLHLLKERLLAELEALH